MNKIFLEFMSFRVPYFLGRALFFYRWMLRSPTRAGLPILDRRGLSRKTSLLGVGSTSRGCSAYRQRQKTVSSDGGGFRYKSLGAEGIRERDRKTMLAALDSYPQAQRDVLLKDIKDIDLPYVESIFKKSMAKVVDTGSGIAPAEDVATIMETEEGRKAWRKTGMKLIAEGKVAILLLAGGQGTRLGSKEPKGCFNVGLPSGKSMFQMHAERILKLQQLAAEEALGEDAKVIFFQQGFLPCLTADGRIIVESDSKIAKAPDGNGGVYMALDKSGCISDMRKHGVECIDCFCVDNLLAKIGDPSFIGYSWELGAECGYCEIENFVPSPMKGARVVQKSSSAEKVGVFAIKDGKLQVVEYSEMSESDASAKDGKGNILYPWGNICMHYFTVTFLEKAKQWLSETGEYHVAHKKIPSVNGPVQGVKLELFIFDTFPLAKKVSLYEVAREEQFAPVKNAEGDDSPESARSLLLALHRRWIVEAGGNVQGGQNVGEIPYNISYGGEGLTQYCRAATIKVGDMKVLDRDFFENLNGS